MALDEPREDDEIFKEGGITFAVNKSLYENVKPIQVDYVATPRGGGYRVSGNLLRRARGGCCS